MVVGVVFYIKSMSVSHNAPALTGQPEVLLFPLYRAWPFYVWKRHSPYPDSTWHRAKRQGNS